MSDPIRFGVIGGSGVYQMDTLTDVEEVELTRHSANRRTPILLARCMGSGLRSSPGMDGDTASAQLG